jgi:hypothetical protein
LRHAILESATNDGREDSAAPAPGLTGEHDPRDIADRQPMAERVEYVREGALIFVPPAGFPHLTIVELLIDRFGEAKYRGLTPIRWQVSAEHLRWEFRDGSRRFFIPDLAVAYPGAKSRQGIQDNVVLLVEITSPDWPETVKNDRDVKPKRYAKNGVPFYLLVDQESGSWKLHALIKGWPRYDVVATGEYGEYGEPIELPEPFGFSVETADWPPYTREPVEE